MTSEQKPKKRSPLLKVVLVLIVVIILAVGLGIGIYFYKPTSTNSNTTTTPPAPYVEVDYKTIGWFYETNNTYGFTLPNDTYLLLNITIINKGYSSAIQGMISLGYGFNVTINGIEYPAYLIKLYSAVYNASGAFDFTSQPYLATMNVKIENGAGVQGFLVFDFTQAQHMFGKSFILGCTLYDKNWSPVQVKIVQVK